MMTSEVLKLALTETPESEVQLKPHVLPLLTGKDVAGFKNYYERLLKRDYPIFETSTTDLKHYYFAYKIEAKDILFPYAYGSVVYVNPKEKKSSGDYLVYDKANDRVLILKRNEEGLWNLRHSSPVNVDNRFNFTVIGKICGIYYLEIDLEDVY